jgi:hypothetical protein
VNTTVKLTENPIVNPTVNPIVNPTVNPTVKTTESPYQTQSQSSNTKYLKMVVIIPICSFFCLLSLYLLYRIKCQ